MSSSDPVWLLLDDPRITFTPEDKWVTIGGSHWLGSSSTYDGPKSLPFASLLAEFQGVSISFVGNTPSTSNSPTTFLASIDSSEPFNLSMPVAEVTQFYLQWYSTPILPDGPHSVNLSTIVTDLDYAIITAGESTPFTSDSLIVVDNDNSEIWYTGNWERDDTILSTMPDLPDGPALGNTTHRSGVSGSSFEFKFSGTSVEVLGVFQWEKSGSVNVDFILDGEVTSQEIVAKSNPGFSEQRNYPFFKADRLTAGNHTLVANITQATGSQVFAFDYILYTPDFSSLSKKPVFSRDTDSTTPTSTSGSGESTTNVSATISGDPTTDSAKSDSGSTTNVGAVVGGVIAGVVAVAILLITLFLLRQRRRNKAVELNKEPGLVIEPFVPVSIAPPVSLKDYKSRSYPTPGVAWPDLSPFEQPSSTSEDVSASHLPPTSETGSGSQDPSQRQYTQSQIDELRRRIDYLAQENARAGVAHPPSYS